MGCTGSSETYENWTMKVEDLEKKCLESQGWKEGEYVAKYTNIEMDGAPYRVRTYYFGCDDKSKPLLIFTHGFMQPILGTFGFAKACVKHFRLIAYDNCNWGLNTRTYDSPAINDPVAAEKWILEFHEKTIDHLDCLAPGDKFFLTGHSHGGY